LAAWIIFQGVFFGKTAFSDFLLAAIPASMLLRCSHPGTKSRVRIARIKGRVIVLQVFFMVHGSVPENAGFPKPKGSSKSGGAK